MSPEDGELMPKHHDFKVLEICRSNAQRGELKPFYPSASRRTLPRLAPGGRPRGLDPIDAPFTLPASIPTDDEALIRQTLRRYRDAYQTLNAQSAHAIQPTVDEASLARAFDGLQAQSLVFDACQMEVRGSSAMAICCGAALYVPKFGRRTPRTERRVWSFTLNKHDGDWTIETAQADQ
jgi:hypothetical protein